MNIFFRTNFDQRIGIGHLSRVFRLYKKLHKKNNCKIFIDKPKHKIPFFKLNKDFFYIYKKKNKFLSEDNDSNKFINFIKEYKEKTIVIIDDYRLGYTWEKKVSKYCEKIVCIEDFINRKHYSDVVINTKPSLTEINSKTYEKIKSLNKKNCKLLLGHKYSILDNISKRKNRRIKKKFIITFYNGGSGNLLIYEKLIKRILINLKKKIFINIILGPYAKNKKKIFLRFNNENIKLFLEPENLQNILSNTNLLISSAGLIILEAAQLKVPSIFIKITKNQELDNISIEKLGHYFILDKKYLKMDKKFFEFVNLIINNYYRIKKLYSAVKRKKYNGINLVINEIYR